MRWVKVSFFALALATVVVVLGGCGNNRDGQRSGKLKVVATFSVLGDFVRQVAGDEVELVTLVGPDGDTHKFHPTAKDNVVLAEADVIFENGIGFESWLDKLYAASGSKAQRVVVTNGLKLRKADEDQASEHKPDHEAGKDAGHNHEDEHGEYDPHVWHDVQNAIHMVEVIRDELVKVDPGHADKYNANASAYLQQLKDLDKWVMEQVASLPESNRKLVTDHDSFGYFAQRYGFKIVGTALGSFSTEAGGASALQRRRLLEAIKAEKVPAIFPENIQQTTKDLQAIAQEAGVRVAPSLYTDALGQPGSEGDSYIKMIRYNVKTIVTYLKP